MKPQKLSCLVLFLALAFSPALCTTASAHVDSDSMPDSVAETEYRIYLEFKPDDSTIINKLGMVYYRLNKLPKAIREFSRVLKKEPDNYDALDGMGLVKAALKDYDEAVRLHRQAIGINPDDMVGYYHLGAVYEKKGMVKEAAEEYRKALERFDRQYPQGTDNKKAAEFRKQVEEALKGLEAEG